MNGRSQRGTIGSIRLIAGREISERLRARSFYVLTGALVVVIIGIGLVNRLVDVDGPGPVEVGLTGAAPDDLPAALASAAEVADREVTVVPLGDAGAARAAVDDGEVDVALIGSDRQVLFPEVIDSGILAIIQQAWSSTEVQQELLDSGLTPDEVSAVFTGQPLEAVTLDGGDDTEPSGLAVLTGTAAAILLFVTLQTFGGYVLTGVVEEKSSAVIEVLLVRARADELLAGKVIGIGVAALVQLAAAVVAAFVALVISDVDVPGAVWSSLPMILVWFLGGYALYSTLFAVAGSLVSRQEEAQAASAPILTALVGAYLLVFFFGFVPDSTASRIMSLIPPIAPLLMPMRMAAGAASVLEVVVSLVLLVITTIGAWKLAGKIYEQVLLRRGSRISWKDALSLSRGG